MFASSLEQFPVDDSGAQWQTDLGICGKREAAGGPGGSERLWLRTRCV